MPKWNVMGEWVIEAPTASDAENLIEDAVAKSVSDSDLITCDATLGDDEPEGGEEE